MVIIWSLTFCVIFAIFSTICILCGEMFGAILFMICSGIALIVFLVYVFMKILYGGKDKDENSKSDKK